MKINKNKLKIFIIVSLITFCIQTPDVKIGFVKISELLLLGLAPFLLLRPINKFLFYFLVFFTVETVIGLIVTSTLNFEVLGLSKIKAPYVITIGRYFELISCICISIITLRLFKNKRLQSKNIINYLIDWNIVITVFFVFLYILVIARIIPIHSSIIVYDNFRLRGLYNEGGPYGLMLGFIFALTFFQKENRFKVLKQLFLFVVIAFCAKSKAGILFTIFWVGILNLDYLKRELRTFMYPILALFIIIFYFIFINLSSMYIKEFSTIKNSIYERPTDPNLILGRVSGKYIVPKMIEENPIFGIGLGNYPLIRNNSQYRTFFPKPPRKIIDIDAHGYGGIVDVIVDMGISGFLWFMFIVYLLYAELKIINKGKILLLGFLLLLVFGVQLSFLYPWVFMGIIIAYKDRYIDEVSN